MTNEALITNIQGYSIHDGPGIRTVVFLKGCGLSCKWCANPECIPHEAQTGFIENLCVHCGKCAAVCPRGAINMDGQGHRIDYSLCDGCGLCADACYYSALVRYGKIMSAAETFEDVRRDKLFYGDDGGVTASGGEPLLHAAFVAELFTLCKNDGISTCIETSGFVKPDNMHMILPLIDHMLFDIKHMQNDAHIEYTAQSNEIILANARMAARHGVDILFRMPLIPGVNDGAGNIRDTAEFVKEITSDPKVQLMPYHRLGAGKYKALNIRNAFSDVETMPRDRIDGVKDMFSELGVECSISI